MSHIKKQQTDDIPKQQTDDIPFIICSSVSYSDLQLSYLTVSVTITVG